MLLVNPISAMTCVLLFSSQTLRFPQSVNNSICHFSSISIDFGDEIFTLFYSLVAKWQKKVSKLWRVTVVVVWHSVVNEWFVRFVFCESVPWWSLSFSCSDDGSLYFMMNILFRVVFCPRGNQHVSVFCCVSLCEIIIIKLVMLGCIFTRLTEIL